MGVIDNQIIKTESIIKIDGGTLVLNLAGTNAKIAPLRIMFFIAVSLMALYSFSISGDILTSLILWVLLSAGVLFGNIEPSH